MLYEESDIFAKDDADIRCIPNLQLKIQLSDETPVQKRYNAIPKPLYQEVKYYVQKLLSNGYIRKSTSPYSSKDKSLRLRVDFRELNRRTVPDRHPLPRIQDLLDNLGGVLLVLHTRPRQRLPPGLCRQGFQAPDRL